MKSIKGLVIQEGATVSYDGKPHVVKSFQLVSNASPILTLAPVSPDLIQVSLQDLDEEDGGSEHEN